MVEEEVYLGTKNYFLQHGFSVLAGQPPRGIDHLPVIEIKNPTGKKGSDMSYKPDLFVFKNNIFYIVECKPSFNLGDYNKLKLILESKVRLYALYTEISQYRLLEKVDYVEDFEFFCTHIKGVLSYCGRKNEDFMDIGHILVSSWTGEAIFYD